jgi:hypothetical protein
MRYVTDENVGPPDSNAPRRRTPKALHSFGELRPAAQLTLEQRFDLAHHLAIRARISSVRSQSL